MPGLLIGHDFISTSPILKYMVSMTFFSSHQLKKLADSQFTWIHIYILTEYANNLAIIGYLVATGSMVMYVPTAPLNSSMYIRLER